MRVLTILCTVAFAAIACAPIPVSAHRHICINGDDDSFFRDEVTIDLKDGSIIFTHEDDDETVEITNDNGLIVNKRPVHLNASEKRLVRDYHDTFDCIVEGGKEIGLDGAKIGVQGAKLGITAALGVLKLLEEDYDSDDLEIELDHKSERMERAAARLERRAERLERRVERLKDLQEQLREEIDEIDDLGWF